MDTSDLLRRIMDSENTNQRQILAEEFVRSIPSSEVFGLADTLKSAFDISYLGRNDSEETLLRFAEFLAAASEQPTLSAVERGELAGLEKLVEGDVKRKHGKYVDARAAFQQAIDRFQEANDRIGYARAKASWIHASTHLGMITETALEAAEEARQIFMDESEHYRVATLDQKLGFGYLDLGHPEQAVQVYQRALATARTMDDERAPYLVAMLEANIGVALLEQGDIGNAEAHFRLVDDVAQEYQLDPEELGETASAAQLFLGKIALARWRPREALAQFQRAITLTESTPYHNANALMPYTELLASLQRTEDALSATQRIVAIGHTINSAEIHSEGLCLQARILARTGEWSKAALLLNQAEHVLDEEVATTHYYAPKLELATLLLAQSKPRDAYRRAQEILSGRGATMPQLDQLHALVIEMEALLAQRWRRSAQAAAEKLLKSAKHGEYELPPEIAVRCHVALAHIAQARWDHRTALAHLERAMALLALFGDNATLDIWSSFLLDTNKNAIFLDGITTALRLGDVERALSYLDLQRTHAQWSNGSSSSSAIAQNLFQHRSLSYALQQMSEDDPEYASMQRRLRGLSQAIMDQSAILGEQRSKVSTTFDLEAIRKALPEHGVALAYAVLPRDIIIFIISPQGVLTHRISRGVPRLRKLCDALQKVIEEITEAQALKGPADTHMRELLRQLWDLLIAPVARHLPADGAPLIVVPHDILHSLPLAALFDGQRYLIERWPLHYLSRLGTLTVARPAQEALKPMLAFGVSRSGSLPELPNAPVEAKAVAHIMGGVPIVEHDATVERFLKTSSGHRYLHLVAHGKMRDDQPYSSFMALADDLLHPVDILGVDLRGCSLVALSGCQTARGQLRGGDAQIGLVSAFGLAGAENVLATLWDVHDQVMRNLMESMYSGIAAGQTPAAALRQAQLACLRSSLTAAPFWWGSLQVMSFVAPFSAL
jgi:CHAT domain-containing protein